MKQSRILVLILLLYPCFLKAQLSGTYTINPSGTQSRNYKTLALAFRALDSQGVSSAVTFEMSNGTHVGQVSLSKAITGASKGQQVTFEGDTASNTNVVIRSTASSNVLLRKVKWLVFKDIYFQSTSNSGYNVFLSDSANHNAFSNCLFKSSGSQYSVRISRSDSTVLERCEMSGGDWGVYLQGWSRSDGAQLTMKQCVLKNSRRYGLFAYYTDDLKLFNNLIDSCQLSMYAAYGTRSNIQNNRFFGGQCTFSYENSNSSSTADSSRFYNNMVYAPGQTSIGLYSISLYNTNVIHNSFHLEGATYGAYVHDPKASVFLNNNWESNGGTYGIYAAFSSSYAPAVFDYNNLSLSGKSSKIYFGNSPVSTLGALKALSTTYNQNSLAVDPTFYNVRNLESVSPSLNAKGLPTHLKTDINGNIRPAKGDTLPDIGCNDYQLPDWCLRIDGLLSPQSVNTSGNVIKAQFKNGGAKTLDSQLVSFSYSVDSGKTWILQRDSVFGVKPGDRFSYTFSQTWTPNRIGQFRIHIRTNFLVAGTSILHEGRYDVCSGIAGVYHVSQSGFQLSTLLNKVNSCGLAGNTTIVLDKGTYQRIALTNFPRTNPNARLIIDGQHPDTATLTNTATAFEGTVDLNGASYVTFRNLTIEHGSGIGAGVRIWNGAHHNTVENCEILPSSPSTHYQNVGVAFSETYSGSGEDSFNVIRNNHIAGQYYGIKAASLWGESKGDTLLKNHIEKYYYYGLYAQNQQNLYVKGNLIENPNGAHNYPLYLYYCSGSKLHGNEIGDHAYGLVWYYENRYSTGDTSEFINNVVTGKNTATNSGNVVSTSISFGQHLKVYHNTFRFEAINAPSNATGTGMGAALKILYGEHIDLRNNVFENVHSSSATVPFIAYGVKNWTAIEGNNYIQPNGRMAHIDNTLSTNIVSLRRALPGYNQTIFGAAMKYDSLTRYRLSLKSSNPRGVPSGIKTDIDGNQRCGIAPSVGASESTITGVSFKVGFISNNTLTQNAVETFLNTGTSGSSASYYWYVNGTLVSSKTDLDHRFTTLGNHEIKLVVKTCGSLDSAVRTLPVVGATLKPKVDFLVTKHVVDINECVDLIDLSQNGPSSFLWAADESGAGVFLPSRQGVNSGKWCNKDSSRAKNPSVYFTQPGSYGVGLKARNGIGVDSLWKANSIEVRDFVDLCGARNESHQSYGRIYDEGGPNGTYGSNRKACGFLIAACNDSTVLRFEDFQLASGSYLKIYDGLSNKGIPLHQYSNNFRNGLTGSKSQYGFKKTLVAKSGFVYLEFSSGVLTDRGFHITWSAEGKPMSSQTTFGGVSLPDTVCEGALFDITTSFNPSFVLRMDGLTYPDFEEVDGIYLTNSMLKTTGTHPIKVVFGTCGGVDSFQQNITVVGATTIATHFSIGNRNPEVNEEVRFMDESSRHYPCITGWLWKFKPKNKRFLFANGTDSTSENPSVIFLDTGYYDVELTTTNSFGTATSKVPRAVKVYRTCTPIVKSPTPSLGITKVSIDNFVNISSVSASGYQDFTKKAPTVLEAGFKYPISVSTLANSTAHKRAVWIDFNKNGSFEDSLEKVASSTSSNVAFWSDSIYIPFCQYNASKGKMKMRVGVELGNQTQYGCGPSISGEFEDYMIEIRDRKSGVIKVVVVGSSDTTIAQCQKWTDPGAYGWSVGSGRINLTSMWSYVDVSTPGAYTVLYKVEDACGNVYVGQRIVRVTRDNLEPEIQLLGGDTLHVEAGSTFTDPGAQATDLCDGNVSGLIKVSGTVNTNILGQYKLTYEVSDAEGNKATKIRVVVVEDTQAPVLDELVGGSVISTEVNAPFVDPGVKWIDNFASTVVTKTNGTVDVTTLGTYYLSYTGVDPSGNVSLVVSRTVKVEDTKAPIVSLALGKDTVIQLEVNHIYTPETVYLNDNYSSQTYLQGEFVTGGTYPQNFSVGKAYKLGSYTYTYATKDESGNIGEAIREIEVDDRTPPVAELRKGGNSLTVARWTAFDPKTDIDLVVSDNYYDSSQITVTLLHNTVNTQSLGKYKVVFGLEDPSGNYIDYMVEVHVVDNAQTIGIDQMELEASVFPNPTTGHIQLQITSGNNGFAEGKILNIQGQVVQSLGSWNITTDDRSFDIGQLNSGLYFLEIKSSDQLLRKRITLVR